MKRFLVSTFVLFLALFGTACGAGTQYTEAGHAGIDRAGNPVHFPETIETIVSLGPASTEILVDLGFGNNIVGLDTFSVGIPGVSENLPTFDMMALDAELLIALMPDVIFATGMVQVEGQDPLGLVREAGIEVFYIPTSDSIAGILEDIRFIAAVMHVDEIGAELVAGVELEVAQIQEIADSLDEALSVYFEISGPPFLFSFGHGVFLHEMIELIGAKNIFADQSAWIAVSDESVPEMNPDVIFTNVAYIEDPVGEILSRTGWETVSAVQNERVYFIDPDASGRPSHNIVRALREMAHALNPEAFD